MKQKENIQGCISWKEPLRRRGRNGRKQEEGKKEHDMGIIVHKLFIG